MTPLILIVGDDPRYLGWLRYNLERENFRVLDARHVKEAVDLARLHQPSLIILGWKLPLMSGVTACRRLRSAPETGNAGIVMLGQLGEEHERANALRNGADDCLIVPFSPAELDNRIRSVLSRVQSAHLETIRCGSLAMDLAAHRVWRNGRDVQLGPIDFRLLRHFVENPGRVFTRLELLSGVWGEKVLVEPRTVDAHVLRLRKALNGDGEPDLIRTVRSVGYALDLSAC